mmetsp:Transcript_4756/g.8543  ORF Transcript_4756/g.8543 Transcript_4756/m.8543 type:complete len:125 (+) Transcript_4756:446-820(+)
MKGLKSIEPCGFGEFADKSTWYIRLFPIHMKAIHPLEEDSQEFRVIGKLNSKFLPDTHIILGKQSTESSTPNITNAIDVHATKSCCSTVQQQMLVSIDSVGWILLGQPWAWRIGCETLLFLPSQ